LVCEFDANSPSNFASSDQMALRRTSADTVISAESAGSAAQLTMKLDPGNAWNTA